MFPQNSNADMIFAPAGMKAHYENSHGRIHIFNLFLEAIQRNIISWAPYLQTPSCDMAVYDMCHNILHNITLHSIVAFSLFST